MRLRLIVDGEDERADGAWNMAVDEALLESAMAPGAVPTLRFYHFDPPAVTFGYGQDVARAVDEAVCRELGIACVRRITGGRALLHHDELTYSVTAPPIARSVRTAYASVAGAIRVGLERLGVRVDGPSATKPVRAPARLPCLAVATGHEITASGDKLVASAMRFRRRGFLVHGSILWSIDRTLWRRVTGLTEDDPLPAIGLRELDGPPFHEAELVGAISSAFAEVVDSQVSPGRLTAAEAARALVLAEKYRSAGWTREARAARAPIG